VVFDGDATADLVIDGNLVSAKHPGVTDKFMEAFLREIESNASKRKTVST
jgi:protease I